MPPTIEYQDCPPQGGEVASQCVTQALIDSVYDLLDSLIDIVNVHLLADGVSPLLYVVRQAGGCVTWGTYEVILNKLKEAADSGYLPKVVVDCNDVAFPDPVDAEDVDLWQACDGYYDSYAELKGCYIHAGAELAKGDCLTLTGFNWLYVLIECAISGGCMPDCDECVKCSIYCKRVWRVTYDCYTKAWGTVTLYSYECGDCTATAWALIGQVGTVCTYEKTTCSTDPDCCTEDDDCASGTPTTHPALPFDCSCPTTPPPDQSKEYEECKKCVYYWSCTYDCDTAAWGAVTQEDSLKDCIEDCADSDEWYYSDTICKYLFKKCGSACDAVDDCDAPPAAPATPTFTPPEEECDCTKKCLFTWETFWDCEEEEYSEIEPVGTPVCTEDCAVSEHDWEFDRQEDTKCYYRAVTCQFACVDTPACELEVGTPPDHLPYAGAAPPPEECDCEAECPDSDTCSSCGSYTATASGVTGGACPCINGIPVIMGRVSTCAYSGNSSVPIPCAPCPGGIMLFVSYGLNCLNGVWTLSEVAPCVSSPGCQSLTWTKAGGGCPTGTYTGANGTVVVS